MKLIENIRNKFNTISLYWASNYPKAWSLGWLTQLSIALILYPLTFIVAMLIPMSLEDTPSVELWFGLGYIPAVFWGLFIIYRLIKYNSEKLFGNRSFIHNFIELPTYLAQFLMPIVIPTMLGIILTFRIGGLIETEDLNQNKIVYEEAQPFFSFDFGRENYMWRDHRYSYKSKYSGLHDMFAYFQDDYEYYESIVSNHIKPFEIMDDYNEDGFQRRDSSYMYNAYLRDSVNQYNSYRSTLKDSIASHKGIFKDTRPRLYPIRFFKFDYPHGQTASSLFSRDDFFYSSDSLKKLYFHKYYKDEKFVLQKLDAFILNLEDFGGNTSFGFSSDELLKLHLGHIYSVEKNTELSKKIKGFDRLCVNYIEQIDYIQKCKSRNFYFLDDGTYFLIIFGFLFGMMLILSLFKNLHWSEFLLGLFIVVITPILLGIIMAILKWEEEAVLITFWIIFSGLFIWQIFEQKSLIRTKKGAILLMVMHLSFTYFPIAILGTLDEVFNFWEWSYFDQYLISSPTSYDPDRMIYNSEYLSMQRNSYGNMMLLGYSAYLLLIYPLWIKVSWLKFSAKPKKS